MVLRDVRGSRRGLSAAESPGLTRRPRVSGPHLLPGLEPPWACRIGQQPQAVKILRVHVLPRRVRFLSLALLIVGDASSAFQVDQRLPVVRTHAAKHAADVAVWLVAGACQASWSLAAWMRCTSACCRSDSAAPTLSPCGPAVGRSGPQRPPDDPRDGRAQLSVTALSTGVSGSSPADQPDCPGASVPARRGPWSSRS